MGVDVSKVKAKAEEEAQRAAQRTATGFKYWSPKAGKNRIRILPPWTAQGANANQFWREIYVHWNIGLDEESSESFPCPTRTPNGTGGVCPVCVYVDKLRATKDPADAEMAQNYRAKQRFYSNIIDLEDPTYTADDLNEWKARQNDKNAETPFNIGDSKIQVFSYGVMIYKELLDYFMDVDISDLSKGHDVIITREGVGQQTKYRTRIDHVPTQFPFRAKRAIEDVLINLDALMPFVPENEMLAALPDNPAFAPAQPRAQVAQAQPKTLPAAVSAPTTTTLGGVEFQRPQAAVKAVPAVAAPVEYPPCFKDINVHSETDAECIGGKKGGDEFDRCPVYEECHAAIVALSAPKRRTAKKASATGNDASADDLEAQMRASLK